MVGAKGAMVLMGDWRSDEQLREDLAIERRLRWEGLLLTTMVAVPIIAWLL